MMENTSFKMWLEGRISSTEAGRLITSRGRETEFTISFKKGNGQNRRLRGMYGISPENPSGTGMTYSPSRRNMVLVSDMDVLRADGVNKAYRSVPLKNITELEIDGERHEVRD